MKTTKEDRDYLRKHFISEIEFNQRTFNDPVVTANLNTEFGLKLLDDLDSLESEVARLKALSEWQAGMLQRSGQYVRQAFVDSPEGDEGNAWFRAAIEWNKEYKRGPK